jgi:hypothetical protein
MATNAAQAELVARWAAPGGLPFKGELISGTGDDTCLCAQGQALHYIGGWDFDRLRNVTQRNADKATAELLGISRAHAVLLRNTNDSKPGAPSIVLTHPELVIGDQAPTILAFWRHLDTMTEAQWVAAWVAAGDAARVAAWVAAGDAARVAAWVAAWVAVRYAAWDAARDAAGYAAGATFEIMGAAILRDRGMPFVFLPAFGFTTPEAVLASVSA